jgi:hypothetical protein
MALSTVVGHYLNALPPLLVTATVTMICIRSLRGARRLRHHGIATRAQVLTSTVLDTNVEYPPKRVVDVTFRTSTGQDVITTVKFHADHRVATGDIITLRYDPAAPAAAMLDLGVRTGLRETRFSVLGIALAAPVAVVITAVLLTETVILALTPLLNR